MEQQRESCNLIITFLLIVASVHVASSSNQNLYTFTTTIDIGSAGVDQVTDYVWIQPSNNATSIYQDTTTYLPVSTTVQAEEEPNSSETYVRPRYVQPTSYQHKSTRKDEDPEGPPDHVIPYSVHEEARDVPTRPKYVAPGVWAKPPPDRNIPLDFVPTKLHAQVRGTHTLKRLPQRHAIESAETDEEKFHAPRLREVVTNTKVNTIYSEEGYEDSGYDHAGHVRDADFHEGFARKLHDREKDEHNSLNSEEGRHRNLVPDEFKEYEEDYQDYVEESRKVTKAPDDKDNLVGYGRNVWDGTELDPKLIAENGIHELEQDIEKDAKETERSSKIYQNTQEAQLHNDIKDANEESEKSHSEDDLEDKENKPAKTKGKKSKLRYGKNDTVHAGTKEQKKNKKKKKKKKLNHENYVTTVLPPDETNSTDTETPAYPRDFTTNPSSSQVYSIDQTTLRYFAPVTTTPFQQADEPRTFSYSQLFWDYFKARQDPPITESFTLFPGSTTMNPQPEERTPIAMATIGGHGPYLFMTKEETTTSPSVFLGTHSFHPQNLFSDRVGFDPNYPQGYNRHLLGRNDDVDYVSSVIAASTVATFTSVQPLLPESLPSLNPKNGEQSSSTALPDITISSSTPVVMTLNITQKAFSRIVDYQENPFLGPIVDNSNITVIKNKSKYKVLTRPNPPLEKKPVKPITHQQVSPPSTSKEQDEYKKIRDELNAKYNKMLNYILNKQKIQSLPEKKKTAFPDDITLMRPPIRQRIGYSTFPTDRPAAVHHPSVSVESESLWDANWKSLSQDQRRSQPVKLPLRSAHVQPVRLIYSKNQFLATKLLPPPMQPASSYANYYNNKKNDGYVPYVGGKSQQQQQQQQQQQRDNAFRYFPPIPEDSWRTRGRRKRSDEGEFRVGDRNGTTADVKAATNNGVTNDGKSEQRDKGSFSRITDMTKGKSSNRRLIGAPIDVLDTRLASPAGSRDGESGTSTTLVDKNTYGESKNVKDEKSRETVINSKLPKKISVPNQLVKPDRQVNYTNVKELMKNKRNVLQREVQSRRKLKNRKGHEELLNESSKISGDVVDKEIAARFNEKDNETSAKTKEERKIEIEIPNFDYVEEFAEDSLVKPSTTTEAAINSKKYPFYNNQNVPSASALKYIVDPGIIPRKTSRGMEFYNSRNAYKQCDEVEANLEDVLPEKEEPDPERGPQEDLPRLRGLGDKLDCFKAKYFDENPLDNPLFAEKSIEDPTPPPELNPTKFASQIRVLPKENDEYVVHRVSKKPERNSRQWWNRNRPYETYESIRVNYKHDPQTGRGRNAYMHTVRGSRPSNAVRRVKSRRSKPKVSNSTTQSPKHNQTTFYQNQVYEDVMGNIRNMANSYQVYEMTTLPPSTQTLATAGSENILKVTEVTSIPSKEKSTLKPNVTDVTSTKSLEIKGLVPPPKYSTPRQTSYRIYRPLAKNRVSLLRSSSLPRIIAHHHAIKLNKRSTTNVAAKDFSESAIDEDKKSKVEEAVKVDVTGNDTVVKSARGTIEETNATSDVSDLKIEESKQVSTQSQILSTNLKIDNKKKRKNFTNSNQKTEPSQKTVYTIRDRIRYSKPKWDARGFGKFNTSLTSSKTTDEDSRRKEPRYNQLRRKKKLVGDEQNNSTIMNSTENTLGIESAASLGGESSTTEVYHAKESVVHETIYRRKDEYAEPEKAESVDTKTGENFFEEEKKEEEEETTTSTYLVHEDINENVSSTTMNPENPENSKEVLELHKYLESDPPGYAETFPEDAETTSNKHSTNVNHELEDSEKEEQDEEIDVENLWDDDSSEKAEEQIETPMQTNAPDDDFEELSSKEEKTMNKGKTFFTYKKRPSLIRKNKEDDEPSKKVFHKSFPFSKYKSKKEQSEEDSEEEEKEGSEDYAFPWQADKEDTDKEKRHKWLRKFNRYEYPWEKRERLARERRRKEKRANRLRQLIFDDEDEEESMRNEKPIYPWQKYDNVPSKSHANTRRDISREYIDDGEESNIEQLPLTKFSSRYSLTNKKPSKSFGAREISRSIKKFLEKDVDDESKEDASVEVEDRSPSFARKSPPSDRGISRGTLVPEDITQSPRRKKTRRNYQVDKNDRRFDAKKLGSKEITDEIKEEQLARENPKLNESSLNDSVSRLETISQQSQLFNSTKEISPATEPRKKRRQRILKNNSSTTVSFNNASADSITEPTKKRRKKSQVSTTPSANVNTDKFIFAPIQRMYSMTDEAVRNNSDSSEQNTVPKTMATENLQVETSTPKTRTIEHRSRVSKEKIVTKTTYPDEVTNFGSRKTNETSARKDPVKNVKTKLRRRKNKQHKNNENPSDKSIKRKNEKEDYDIKFKSGKSEDDPLKNAGIHKDEVKKINDFSAYDGIINDENIDSDDFRMSSEVSLLPQHRTVQLTQYGSRQIMSSMSWISKNYDY